MHPLAGAGVSILLLCGLLVLRIPDACSVAAAIFFNYYFSNAWMMTMPQTMMSGISQVRFDSTAVIRARRWADECRRDLGPPVRVCTRNCWFASRWSGACERSDEHVFRRHDWLFHRRPGRNWIDRYP